MPDTGASRKKPPARAIPTKATGVEHDTVKSPKQASFAQAATVHDRILLWQTQGVDKAVDPDVISVRSLPRSEACQTPRRLHSPTGEPPEDGESRSVPRQSSTKWVQKENSSWIKQRRSTRAPKDFGAVQDDVTAIGGRTSLTDSGRPRSPYVRTDSQKTRDVRISRAEREQRRKRRREMRARADGGDYLVEDGIRVYNKSKSDIGAAFSDQHSGDGSPSEPVSAARYQQQRRRSGGSSPPYKSQLSFVHDGSLPGGDHDDDSQQAHTPIQASKYAQTLGQPQPAAEDLNQPKTRKRALLNKTKKILVGKPDIAQSNRMPSIEAWLEDQPGEEIEALNIQAQEQAHVPREALRAPRRKSHRHDYQDIAIDATISTLR